MKVTEAEVEKLVDPVGLSEFNAEEFVQSMREFVAQHPEVQERIIVYVNEKMKQDIVACLTDEEKADYELVGLVDLCNAEEDPANE